ncbi:Peroxiredoxin-6 [Nymphon striatum]|nr:Peroxiredoxin-6 [Nymphon striatum]
MALPFQFEPEFTEDENTDRLDDSEEDESEDEENNSINRRSCHDHRGALTCGRCENTDTEEMCVCCKELGSLSHLTTGNEILRVIDSLKLTAEKKVATPVDWKHGQDCMVIPSVKEEDLPKLFPKGVKVKSVPSGKSYLRITPQPE